MDSLRPDFLSCYGHHLHTSPNIDKLAADGVLFRNAFAPSTWTRPSGASILSGLYPEATGLISRDDFFDIAFPRLPQVLQRAEYKTVAVSTMPNISKHFGFGEGFDQFIDLYKEDSLTERLGYDTDKSMFKGQLQSDRISIPTSEDINTYVMPIIEKLKDGRFFLFLWSIDTHNPYFIRGQTNRFPPSPNQNIFYHQDVARMKTPKERQQLIELYEKMIYFNDYQIGYLLEHLKKLGIYEETLIIIVSDHGEAFGEHGRNGHCSLPYDEQIRVPLIIKFPRGQFAGHESKCLSQLIDIFPTLLDYLSIKSNLSLQGKSLLPAIRQRAEVHRVVHSITHFNPHLESTFSIRSKEWKLILFNLPRFSIKLFKSRPKTLIKYFKLIAFQPRKMLFNLFEDGEEKQNLAKIRPDICTRFERVRMELVKQNKERRNSGKITTELRSDIKEHLKALGYID